MFKKTPQAPARATAAPSHDERADDLGPFPADVDSNPTRNRVLERALRMTTIGLGVSALSNVAFVGLIIGLMPLKEVMPYLVKFSSENDQVVQIQPLNVQGDPVKYMAEADIRQYITLRHSFVPINSAMDDQWGPNSQLAAMTDENEFKEFQQTNQPERAKLMSAGLTREIKIESVSQINETTWQVNFTTTDAQGSSSLPAILDPNAASGVGVAGSTSPVGMVGVSPLATGPTVRSWVATMTIGWRPQTITYGERLLNPLGFTVTDYSVTARN